MSFKPFRAINAYISNGILKDARQRHSCVKKILLEDEQVDEEEEERTVHEDQNNETESA